MSPCSSTCKREVAADQRVARQLGEFAIGVVDKGDAAVGVAQHDQIALRFEQAAGAFLGFLQFPVAVGQRFVVQGDLARFSCASSAAACSASQARRRRSRTGSWRRSQKRGGHSRNPSDRLPEMNPYAPPNAAEKIVNERTAKSEPWDDVA